MTLFINLIFVTIWGPSLEVILFWFYLSPTFCHEGFQQHLLSIYSDFAADNCCHHIKLHNLRLPCQP